MCVLDLHVCVCACVCVCVCVRVCVYVFCLIQIALMLDRSMVCLGACVELARTTYL